ncbi:DUF3015 family protein, partial [Acinetobacter baumannii]
MLKKLALAALLAAGSSVAMADNDVGCGVGTQVWAGQKGVVPKILAATTNGIFTNQLLGITFGTLGCRQGGTVTAQVVTFTNDLNRASTTLQNLQKAEDQNADSGIAASTPVATAKTTTATASTATSAP